MSDSPDPLAQSVFARFLAEREEDRALGFESWCARQPDVAASPELAARLAKLHAAWRALAGDFEAQGQRDRLGSFFRPRERHGAHSERTESSDAALRPGQHIGPFVLQSFIAQGGMGQVWVAQDQSLRRQVALKLVLPGRVDLRSVELFAREARAGGRLAHPNIVTTLAHGSDGGLAWIAQELVEGSWTLKDFLDELRAADAVPKDYYPRVAELVAQLADVLAAAHDAGVIHRDVKPQNVLIAPDDRPKLTDFGLARVVDDSVLSRSGDFAGTYAYMSPEQVTAKRMGLDHRTDVFSLGIVLYELLTLRRPFEGDTTHQIAAKIVTFDPPDAAKIRSQCPRDLAVICAKAFEKDPDRRYQTMREFAADLRRHVANQPIHARPSGPWIRTVKWAKRHPVASSSGAVAALAFAIVAGLLAVNVRTNHELSKQTRIANDNATLAEQRAGETAQQARIASEEAERARRAEHDAEQRAGILAALRRLESLAIRAKEPSRLAPHPHLIARIEEWLREARELVDGRPADPQTGMPAQPSLADHRARLADLLSRAGPGANAPQLENARAHALYRQLAALRAEVLWHRRMLGEEPWPERADVEARTTALATSNDGGELNRVAWSLVDPKAPQFGDEVPALVLAERALAAPERTERQRAFTRDTLSWAQFRTGRLEDALRTCAQAASEVGDGSLDSSLASLRAAVAEWEPDARADRRDALTLLVARQTLLEHEVGECSFEKEDDVWWIEQLTSLVTGIEALHDPETGLVGDTLNAAFGWGMTKRREFARTIRERSIDGPEARRSWAEAIAAVRSSPEYGGLELTPQLGLLPIGKDPDSQLWEFAHLQSGEVPDRVDGKLVRTERMCLVFVLVPGGAFRMGSRDAPGEPNHDPMSKGNEGPVHEVTLSPYFISKFEMTQGQWLATYATNPSRYFPGEYALERDGETFVWTALHPVERVTWLECVTAMEFLGLSLPSEAQWEHSARGGSSSIYATGDEFRSLMGAANLVDEWVEWDIANSQLHQASLDDGSIKHAEVGSYRANGFGLHDVHGNVQEWCLDRFDSSAYGRDRSVDPVIEPRDSTDRVIRGGSFDDAAHLARVAFRGSGAPEHRAERLGLRPARGITP